jgi:hypothetical protein
MNQEIPLAPICGWEVAPISAYNAITVRLQYLTHNLQPISEAHTSPMYVLLAPQCRELIDVLQRKLQVLENGPPEGSGLPRH